MNKIAVFQTKEGLDAVLPLPSGVRIGEPAISEDGRVAICHQFIADDLEYLVEGGAEIRDILPDDWRYPEPEEPS